MQTLIYFFLPDNDKLIEKEARCVKKVGLLIRQQHEDEMQIVFVAEEECEKLTRMTGGKENLHAR